MVSWEPRDPRGEMLQLRPVPAKEKKKKKSLVLFRLKGGKEAVAEAGGRVAEGNRASRGVSVLDKQSWDLRGQQPLLGELFAFQNEDGPPPGQEEPPEPSCAWH